MNWGGAFVTRTQRGPSRFTGFNGYPQPTLAAFSPVDPNLIIAAGIDSGVFVTTDAGAAWDVVSDPFNPTASGTPHIPRPKFAHFDHLADGPDGSKVDILLELEVAAYSASVSPMALGTRLAGVRGPDPKPLGAPVHLTIGLGNNTNRNLNVLESPIRPTIPVANRSTRQSLNGLGSPIRPTTRAANRSTN